ncbi:hypothetical protein C2G38_2174583 [Gigaspora rosea]|uniref:Uncharacterized protein n=1 Tax=Gigaspora rosea TaxID=44941 RepID=A0A397VT22_9GLOM|nr:hypothetical protein C2G38_2174583 [Gigaspora rosea]
MAVNQKFAGQIGPLTRPVKLVKLVWSNGQIGLVKPTLITSINEVLAKRIEHRKKRLWCLYDSIPLEEDSDCSVMESVYENQDTEDDGSDSEIKDHNEDEQTGDHIVKKKRRHVSHIITEFEDEEMKNIYRFIFIHTLTTDNNTVQL